MILRFDYTLNSEKCTVKVKSYTPYIKAITGTHADSCYAHDGGEVIYEIFNSKGENINDYINTMHDENICYKALTELDPNFF